MLFLHISKDGIYKNFQLVIQIWSLLYLFGIIRSCGPGLPKTPESAKSSSCDSETIFHRLLRYWHLNSGITHHGIGSRPQVYGAGCVPLNDLWKYGFICVANHFPANPLLLLVKSLDWLTQQMNPILLLFIQQHIGGTIDGRPGSDSVMSDATTWGWTSTCATGHKLVCRSSLILDCNNAAICTSSIFRGRPSESGNP